MTTDFKTGQKTIYSGIYQCRSCLKKKTFAKGKKLVGCQCGGSGWRLYDTPNIALKNDRDMVDHIKAFLK